MIYDDRVCSLGEGPLWHPERGALFWFDINGHRLHSKQRTWQFDEHVSAAGWTSRDTLLIASESKLFRFDLTSGTSETVAGLEADNPVTRSNDGRADPQGGFWIGTMGKKAEPQAGAIYRYYRGEVRVLFANITIPNSICFTPDGAAAYFCDTPTKQIMRVGLGPDGWPEGAPTVAVDLRGSGENPDGSVVDAAGNIWNAQWGAGRVACYSPDGRLRDTVPIPARHTTCPAFAGRAGDMYITSATEGLTTPMADDGKTFKVTTTATGQCEHKVIL